ncbi:MAG: glycosyltransferase [Armatimonadetes bacterium]|nr:glycosyltransferase [Armatimonadota bacterium]
MTYTTHKNILMVVFHFPPDGAVGARRSGKIAKYLPGCGWTPHVLTAQERFYDRIEEHPGAPKGCVVVRTGMIRNPMYWSLPMSDLGLGYSALGDPPLGGGLNPRPTVEFRPTMAATSPAWKRFIRSLLWMPDDKQGWVPYAVAAGLKHMRANRIDCIYSSGPPWSGHLAALMLHIVSGLPWAADFRDPWSTYRFKPAFATSRLSEGTEVILRRMVYRKASAIICNTPQAEADIRKSDSAVSDKLTTITNGFDPDDAPRHVASVPERSGGAASLPGSPLSTLHSPLTFVHTGTLLRDRDPGPFMAAVDTLISDGLLDPNRIRLDLIGACEVAHSSTRALMDKLTALGVLNEHGVMPRADCLRALAGADACLLLDMDRPTQVPAKLYDYMLVRKPVLAVTEPGSPVAGVVERTGCGIIADCGSREAMCEGILRMFDIVTNSDKRFSPNESELAKFDFTSLVSRCAGVFDSITCKARRKDVIDELAT